MDEIGDELNDKPENNGPVEELSETTKESDELNEFDDELPDIFGESDEIDDELPDVFGESDEIDDELPDIFGESDEIDDELPDVFGEADEIDYELPNIFGESDEIDYELPNIFGESDEIDNDLPDTFGEADEIDDILNDTTRDKEEPNEANEAEDPVQFNPNEGSENLSESDQYEMGGDDESYYNPYEFGDNFEQEGNSEGFYENFNAESMNTVLLSENLIYAYLKEYIELMVEKETEVVAQGEQAEVDNSNGEVSELEQFLQEERERIRLEQQQAGLDEIIELEPELVAKEEEVENQEMKLEEELQSALHNESIESSKVEEIEEKNEELQPYGIEENIEERENKLKINDEKNDKYEQHQSKTQIEEEHEEFTKEGELSQISQELEVIHEINSNETEVLTNGQEEELEQEYISPYREKQREIKEYKDPQQELEEILEQTREIEQEALIEVEQEKSDKNIEENYEKVKKLYNQETGKRPIYSNKETKGFKQWLEQKKKSKEKHEHLQIEEDNAEALNKGIEQESKEEINPKMQLLIKEIIENYNFLENLTTRFKELYGSAQNKQISKAEKNELKLLINSLKKVGPTKFMLFAGIKAIKRYANKEKFSDKAHLNHALNHLFTKFLQKNLIFTYENVENKEKLKLKELINSDTEKTLMNPTSSELSKYSQQEIEFFNKHGINAAKFKYRWNWLREDLLVPFFLDVLYKKGNKVPTSSDLQKWGYNRFIIILREKYGLTFSDLVEMAGKTPNVNTKRRKNFTTEEREFLIKNKIKPENLTTRWEWIDLFPELMTEFFNKVLYSINNRVPTSRELKKRGYSQFIEKLRNNGMTLGDLVKECGYTPRSSHHHNMSSDEISSQELFFLQNNNINLSELTSRWSWMDDYPHLIVPFFIDVLLPFFGHVPTWNEVANTKFYGYIQKLSKFNLTYPEVILKANYAPNYQILNELQKRKLYKSIEFLANKYLETGSKPPSLLKLAKSNIFKISDSTFGKYAKKYLINVYGDEYGNQLYSEMWINKTVGISDDIIKTINFVVENSSNKFIRSNERPIPIKDIVEYIIPEISLHTFTKYAKRFLIKKYGKQKGNKIYTEMWPNENIATKVGSRLHVLINDLLTKFFDKKGIQYFSEPYIFPGRRPDGTLIITKELKMLLKKNTNFLEKINLLDKNIENFKAIVLDFTSDISDLNCKKKILKYQHPEILLLIIGTSWYSKKPFKIINGLNHDINNIRIIDIDILTKIIGLSSSLKAQLKDFLKHAKNYSIESLNRIKTLDKIQLHNTESLKQLLIDKGLIKECVQEFLDFGLINHPVKTLLTTEDRFSIWNKNLLKNKIAIIDIETTGFNRHLDSILEIGIVELDTKTGKMKTLFNSLVRDSNFDIFRHLDNDFVKNSGIDITEIINFISIKECEKDLQLIFDNYRCAAYNSPFDFGWLESRGFSIPMKLMDVMRFCRKTFPTCGSFKFQEVYRYVNNLLKKSNNQYLTRSEYITNHRAIDDAICEAELLFYLIKELGFVLSYQSKIFRME